MNNETPDVITLTEEELVKLNDFDKKLNDLKGKLADGYLQKCAIDEALAKLTNIVNSVRAEFIAAAKVVAKVHGIDLDQPNQGNYSLNLAEKSLRKINPQ